MSCLITIGMLSKSKGQVLRVAAVMHVLFHMSMPTIPSEISENAVKAADSFVDYCLQQAAYLGGRGNFQEAIQEIRKGQWHTHCLHWFGRALLYQTLSLFQM